MPVKNVVKKVKDLKLEFAINMAIGLIDNKRYASPEKFYFSPNQNIEYLLNTYQSMKNLYESDEKKVKSVLFVGGVLYSGIIKGLEKELKVDVIEMDYRVILTQLYSIYCIQNNGKKKSTLNHLLLDNFVKSDVVKNPLPYTTQRIDKEFENFIGFIGETLNMDESRKLFETLFNLKKVGDTYFRGLPSTGSNPSIIPKIFEKLSFKPDFPDTVYSMDAILADFKCKEKYDLILSNNVFELAISPSLFFQKMHKLLNPSGLMEATILRNNKELENPYFDEVLTVPNAGKAYGVYEIFENADKKLFSRPTDLQEKVKILKKKNN